MQRLFTVAWALMAVHLSYGQADSILLDPVDVLSDRLQVYAAADRITVIDSSLIRLNQANSIARLLSEVAPLNIRAYGWGGLSTASIRGTGSNQTAVIWEGLNLQSQMNGSLDLNLVPAFMIDDITVQSGGSSSMFGSGAVGGSIQLGNSLGSSRDGLQLSLNESLGSFGMQSHGIKTQYNAGKLSVGLRGFYKKADNDYGYYNKFTLEDETMDNAGIRQYGAMANIAYRATQNQQWQLKYWYQDNFTKIPKTAGAGNPSLAIQEDDFHRAVLQFSQIFNPKLKLNYHLGYLQHDLHYDNKTNTNSHSESNSVINEARLNYQATSFMQFELGSNYTYENAKTGNYSDLKERQRLAFFLSSSFLLGNKLELNLLGRQSMIDGETTPFLPTLALNYHANSWLSIKAKATRSYRIPTFNDLYWEGSSHGNPDLVPEQGYGFDLGYVINSCSLAWSLHYEGTFFYNHIQDWILWVAQGSVWSPENKDELWSYGIEQGLKASYSLDQQSLISLSGNYQFVISTLQLPSELIPELQTSYTPYHQGNAYLSYRHKVLHTGINLSCTGEQYSDDGNTEVRKVNTYFLTDLNVGYDFDLLRKHQIQLTAQVNNLFDSQYEVRRGYPMPGINYQFNIVYQLN